MYMYQVRRTTRSRHQPPPPTRQFSWSAFFFFFSRSLSRSTFANRSLHDHLFAASAIIAKAKSQDVSSTPVTEMFTAFAQHRSATTRALVHQWHSPRALPEPSLCPPLALDFRSPSTLGLSIRPPDGSTRRCGRLPATARSRSRPRRNGFVLRHGKILQAFSDQVHF